MGHLIEEAKKQHRKEQHAKFDLEINHSQTELLFKESGITHTFLRNNWSPN